MGTHNQRTHPQERAYPARAERRLDIKPSLHRAHDSTHRLLERSRRNWFSRWHGLDTPTNEGPSFWLYGCQLESLNSMTEATESEDATIVNERYRITFDTQRGGMISLFGKQLDYKWIDSTAGHPLHGFVMTRSHITMRPNHANCFAP